MEFDDLFNKAKATKAPEMEVSTLTKSTQEVDDLMSDLQKQERKRQQRNWVGIVCLALTLPLIIWMNVTFSFALSTGIGFFIVYAAFVFGFFFIFTLCSYSR